MQVIPWPFRLGRNGRVVTVDSTSDELVAARLSCLIQTRPGERSLAPGFGMPDPTFSRFDPNALTAGVAQFGPDGISIGHIVVRDVDDTEQRVTIPWDRREDTA